MRDDACVELIGLGPLAEHAGEGAHLCRIDRP
jgi:hypothetical protein